MDLHREEYMHVRLRTYLAVIIIIHKLHHSVFHCTLTYHAVSNSIILHCTELYYTMCTAPY